MRTLACTTLIAAMSLAVSGAAAPKEERGLSEILVRAPVVSKWYMPPEQLAEIQGTYVLSNGQSLRVTHALGRLYADLNLRGETELVPIAENLFVSKDRAMVMEFKPIAFGDEIVLSYRTDLAAAQPTWVTVRLATNR